MRLPGRPKGEYRSAQHEGCLIRLPGRRKCENRVVPHDDCLMSPHGVPAAGLFVLKGTTT